MTLDDYEAVLYIWAESGLDHRPNGRDSRDAISRQLEIFSKTMLVAEENGKIIGVIFGTHDRRKGWINRLAVLPAAQGRGIAKELIAAVEHEFLKAGINIIAATIYEDNKASIKASESMGYVCHVEVKYFSKRLSPDY